MGSSSLTDSGSSSPPNSSIESLNGLKFGKKIYFEGAGSSSAASGGSGSGTPPKKVRSGGASQGGQPPRCQVEGCRVDLSDAKAYYSRHKVCGMHSKSPKVIVGGIEQRFCQQCSRFHQLTEFDQGKRSCRRRLAGHNERRRKPPPGSLLSSRFGRYSSSGYDNGTRMGSFLMDFTAYPRVPARDEWPSVRSSDRGPGNQTNGPGKLMNHPWQSHSEHPPPDLFLQGSTGGTGYSAPTISPGECFTGVADTTCALSLLSNQPWGSRNQPSALGVNHIMHTEGSPINHSTPHCHGTAFNHFPNASWAVKAVEASGSSNEIPPDLGLCQYSQPLNSQFTGDLELTQQNRRQYMELDHSRAYDSTHQMHWSL